MEALWEGNGWREAEGGLSEQNYSEEYSEKSRLKKKVVPASSSQHSLHLGYRPTGAGRASVGAPFGTCQLWGVQASARQSFPM